MQIERKAFYKAFLKIKPCYEFDFLKAVDIKHIMINTRPGLAVLTLILFFSGQEVMAQNHKFGHINKEELIQNMPEFDSAQAKLDKLNKELISYLDFISAEFNAKYDEYNKGSRNLSEIVRKIKEQELNDMSRRIEEFQISARTQLQEKQTEFFRPVYLEVEKAIRDVGKENGFSYIFDVSQGIVPYFDESASIDVTVLVKAKLK